MVPSFTSSTPADKLLLSSPDSDKAPSSDLDPVDGGEEALEELGAALGREAAGEGESEGGMESARSARAHGVAASLRWKGESVRREERGRNTHRM